MSEAKLRRELDVAMAEMNKHDEGYEYEIGEHADGLAVDLTKNGDPPKKVLGQVGKAVMRAGYVISGTLVWADSKQRDYTRVFLHEADKFFDLDTAEDEIEIARQEGFLAGMFFAGMAQLLDVSTDETEPEYELAEGFAESIDENQLVRELEGVETAEDAVKWIQDEHSKGAAHVSSRGPADGVQPYTVTDTTPPGWEHDTRSDFKRHYLRKQ